MFCSLRVSFLVLLEVLLFWSAQGQGDCNLVKGLFDSAIAEGATVPSGSLVDSIFSIPRLQEDNMCQLADPTCCSAGAEGTFKKLAVDRYLGDIKAQVTEGFGSCRNHSVFEAVADYIRQSKIQVLRDFQTVFGSYFEGQEELFDQFYDYLANSILTGNSTNLPAEFQAVHFKLYLATFLTNPVAPRDLENTGELRSCFYDIFLDMKGNQVQGWLNGLQRAYTLTMRYLRALKVVERVVDGILDFKMTELCKTSLMRMTHCGQCAGYSNAPCNSMCQNTLRGCLLDLKELEDPLQDFSEALVAMGSYINGFDFYDQVTLLGSNFFMLVRQTTASFQDIVVELTTRCPSTRSSFRRKRQAPENGPRNSRINVNKPLTTLNDSSHCLQHSLDLFEQLPTMYCSRARVVTDDRSCWNGQYVGSYNKDVEVWTRSHQFNNPELHICSWSQFENETRLLRYMTRELNALTDRCSLDDEDCLQVVPTTHYYDLDAIDLSSIDVVRATAAPDEIEVSGSGEVPTRNTVSEAEACLVEAPTSSVDVGVVDKKDMDEVTARIENTDNYSAGRGLTPSGLAVVVLSVLALVLRSS